MIGMLLPTIECTLATPTTLPVGEIEGYDFTVSALHILQILGVLEITKIIRKVPFDAIEDVLFVIEELIEGIDFDSDEFQTNEKRHIRVEYHEEMLSLEVFVGV